MIKMIEKEVSDALHVLLHCALKDKEYETQKEQFNFVYDYIFKLENNWNELKSWGEEKIKNANKFLNDPNKNWDEDARGYVLARKFQLEEMLKVMQELEQGKDEGR